MGQYNCIEELKENIIVALAGNPNTGKSTVFNSLTGLKQHTGNWAGKTVSIAKGKYKFKDKNFLLVDLPGTYSILSNSAEEEVARDFICFGNSQTTIVVVDATCLERNLNLVLQILEITSKVVVCVNLMDEASKKKIHINLKKLSKLLGVPVVGCCATKKEGLLELMDAVYKVATGVILTNPVKIQYRNDIEVVISHIEEKIKVYPLNNLNQRWVSLKLLDNDDSIIKSINNYLGYNLSDKIIIKESVNQIRDKIVYDIVMHSEKIKEHVIYAENIKFSQTDRKIDDILTSKLYGIPLMLLLLGLIFWITIVGANVPSKVISDFLFGIEDKLTHLFMYYNFPNWLYGVLILGVYRTLAWVVSVMLPPMAIFFPLFTLLEDLGYLPRIAFNLDKLFKKSCAHGKQSLTMCAGLGCNAVGVMGCRIIDSPRERLIAIITNAFVPCNGRFPTLIAITTIFICGSASIVLKPIIATITICALLVLSVAITLITSKVLSKTILKGLPSSFTLELPPYRKPQIGRIIVRSVLDRTIFVLGRAAAVAVPAGLVIWIMANISIDGVSILKHCALLLDPFAKLLGMDGYILMAFILGLPANEIVMPIIIMSYMQAGTMSELQSLDALKDLLILNGWTWLTAVNVMLFSLMHFPCATTLLTIKKETKSLKWTFVSFIIPTLIGIIVTFVVTQMVNLFIR